MSNNTAAVQRLIDSNPKACFRTLEKKLARLMPEDFWKQDVTDQLLAARPNCNWDACDDRCPYSGRCEA
jgi:hypothetical protein